MTSIWTEADFDLLDWHDSHVHNCQAAGCLTWFAELVGLRFALQALVPILSETV